MVERFFKRCSRVLPGSLLALMAGAALWLASAPAASALQSVAVAWNPSPASSVTGYSIYYGNQSGSYNYKLDAGMNTAVSIPDLQEGETNYFVVRAHNAQGVESAPSNELSFIVPGVLNVASKISPRSAAMISFPVASGRNYLLQATEDFQTWTTIWKTTGTANNWVQYADREGANLRMRFYRLVLQ